MKYQYFLIALALLLPLSSHAKIEEVSIEKIEDDSMVEFSIIESGNAATGFSATSADLGSDGIEELILGNGLGNEPRVTVLDSEGHEIGSFLAYAPDVGVGIEVESCDINGDGINEIITAPKKGGWPLVKIFDAFGNDMNMGFFAYAENFREGIHLSCGNLDDDKAEEIITSPAVGGGPHIRMWKSFGDEMKLEKEFFAFDEWDRRGIISHIEDNHLLLANELDGLTNIQLHSFRHENSLIEEHTIFHDGNGITQIFIEDGDRKVVSSSGEIINLETRESSYLEGVEGSFTLEKLNDSTVKIPVLNKFSPDYNGKLIIVDISEQRLYAYENDIVANTFLISTARRGFTTPIGEHSVLAKVPEVHYAWNYGPGHPNNYDLGLVPWNLRIYPHIYIHYAYWHNDFGRPRSAGCINANLDNMKWVYDWADEGIPVRVQE